MMRVKILLGLVSSLLLSYSVVAQGDDCATAITLSSNGCTNAGQYDNTGITGTLVGGGSCFTGGNNNGMWFQFTATTQVVNIQALPGTMTNPEITLLENATGCTGTFTEIGCSSPGGTATIDYSALTVGTTYYIYLDGQNNEVGNFQLCLSSPSAPLNDDPCNAFVVPATNFCSAPGAYTNVGATDDNLFSISGPGCFIGTTMNSVFFEFTATGPYNEITVDGGGTGLANVNVAVIETPNCAGTSWSSNGTSNCASGAGPVTMNANNLTPGTTYLIVVDGGDLETGTFQLCVNSYFPTAGPPNDDCATATALCPGGYYEGTTDGATNITDINDMSWNCNAVTDNAVWYSFVAETPVQDVVFQLSGSSTGGDPVQFEVFEYTGGGSPCDNPTAVNNGFNSIACTQNIVGSGSETFTVSAGLMTAGETYYINVDNWPGEIVTFDFSVSGNAGANAGADEIMCSGDPSTNLVGTPAGGTWFGPGITNGTTGAFDPSLLGPGVYTVFYEVTPCTDQKVIVIEGVDVTASPDVTICNGDSTDLAGSFVMYPSEGPVTFSNTTAAGITNTATTTSDITVSGITPNNVGLNPVISVCLDITHTWDSDLDIYLQCPNGSQLMLTTDNGGSGDNYSGTCFTATGPSITTGAAPFSGSYSPEEPFTNLNGCDINGTWTLIIDDDAAGDDGTLNEWSISFNSTLTPTYTWSPTTDMINNTTLTPTVFPTTTTTYTLSATTPGGCTGSDDVVVTVTPCPTPTINPAPADVLVQCLGDVPAMVDLTWVDACIGTGTVPGVDVSDGLSCPETITRTWTYTNPCGNSVSVSQIITVNDTQVPVLDPAPAAVTVSCTADVPVMVDLTWTDNCDGTGTVTGSDVSDGGTCPEIITRTWTYTDACNNTATVTQTITIHDLIAPVLTAPAAVTVSCTADVPAMVDLTWTDNCDGTGTVTGSDVSDGGTCPEIITRTWTYTDVCNNTTTVNQTITIHDLIAPVLTAPAAVTVSCTADVPAMVDLTWTDNCDGTGTVTGSDVSDGGTCPEIITRTWTYTDACNNTTTVTQAITIHDLIAPVLDSAPADVTVECAGDVPAMVDLTWTDNCDGTGTVTGSDVSDGGSCPEIITRTWTYTDACGNTATTSQTITIDDTTPPTASNPTPISVAGGDPIPGPDVTVVTDEADNCTVTPTVTWISDVSDNGNCPEIITRTYEIEDDCGNTTQVTQTISIGDAVMPTASNPLPMSFECAADVPAPDPLVVTDEADNGATPVVTFESETTDGLSCPETITRTYRVTDDCGNFIFVTQTITIHDITAPVLDPAPAAVTVSCSADVPVMTDLAWTDNCDGAGTVAGTDVSDGLSCPETITRTWTYTDACGNVDTKTQIITVHDLIAPVLDPTPADVTVSCSADVPAMTDLGWTDNCDGTGTVTGTDVSDGLTCPETITRTWTYTDACGNVDTKTQTITVHDLIAPVLAPAPAAVTVECAGDIPVDSGLAWTDNCDGAGMVIGTDVSDGLSCPETITRTWTYTDVCGNTATATQTITVDDTTPPTASNPATTTVPVGPAPAVDVAVVIDEADNCTVNPTVTFISESTDNNPCPETITRIYEIEDDCGNTTQVTHTILITDPFMPTASNPLPVSVECIGDVPAPDPLVVTDEADNQGAPTVAFVSDASDGQTCPETITRTYSVTDLCLNQILVTQTITVHDLTAPVLDPAPADVTVSCSADVPAMVDLAWTDNCDGAGTVTGTDVSDGLSCPETITRTWTYTDACNNTTTTSQTIIVHDLIAPVLDPTPVDVTVSCSADVPAMVDLAWTDNCDGVGTVTGVDVSDGLSCPETITRTWTITDACNNTTTTSQTIVVHDLIAPVLDPAPADVTVSCSADVPAMVDLAWTDNCDGAGTVTGTDVSDGLSCPETITRTWTYTDACNNTTTTSQTIVVHDVVAPVFTFVPPSINVQCPGDVPAIVDLEWTDNCDGIGMVVGSEVSDGLSCPETITRTWTYTDACGNTSTVQQTIVVNDVILPTASNPTPISVPGANDVPAPDVNVVIDEADNCTVNPVVAWVSDVSDGNVCNGEIVTRTYSVTDDCGNQILVTQEITILATPAPIDAGPDQTICLGSTTSTVVDNPWNAILTWSPTDPTNLVSPTQTTTYTVVADNLGCISSDDVTITVEAPPVVSFMGDVLSGCEPLTVNFTSNTAAASGIDNCEWFINGETISGCGPINYTFQNDGLYDVSLTVTSNTGCETSVTYQDYIYVEATPNASFVPSQTDLSTLYTEVMFENTSTGAVDYSWNFGDNTGTSTEVNPTHEFPDEESGSYVVELTAYSDLGCVDVATVLINVQEELIFYVPNTFTPDGDDYNEYFQPVFTSGYDPFDFSLLIFNRWGEIVWESHDASVGWDGTYGVDKNIPVQDGTYTWKIEFKTNANDERVMITGHVNVIR